jgi:hypothetical protein
MLGPFAPHLAAELWAVLQPLVQTTENEERPGKASLGFDEQHAAPTLRAPACTWPALEPKSDSCRVEEVKAGYSVKVMVDGKDIGFIALPQAPEELSALPKLREALEAEPEFRQMLGGKQILRMVHIKRREANLTWVNIITSQP